MNIHLIFSVIIPFLILSACKNSTQYSVDPPQYQNLILNPSFEKDEIPSLYGWSIEKNIDSAVKFSEDVPPLGGRWSVVLEVGDRTFAKLRATVPVQPGSHSYRLSVWSKSKGKTTAVVRLLYHTTIIKSFTISDTVWTFYQILDTINAVVGDSLSVELDGGITEFYSKTYFDLCRLERVN